jgi:hypothetical protein
MAGWTERCPLTEEHRTTLRIADGTDGRGKAELTHHLYRKVRRLGQVVRRPGGTLAECDELAGASPEAYGQRLVEVVLAVEVSFYEGKLLGDAEGLSGGQDRHLGDGIGVVRR